MLYLINSKFGDKIKVLYYIYSFIVLRIRKSRLIFWLIFRYLPNNLDYDNLWDWTSLQLIKCLRKYSNKNLDLLDMGTGPFAVLAIYCRNNLNFHKIHAVDYIPSIFKNATQQESRDITFIMSNLFEKVNDQYGVICFNAPYIVKSKGEEFGNFVTELSEMRWSGGLDGTETIERFLDQAKDHLKDNGVVLLGINTFHLSDVVCSNKIEKCHYRIIDKEYNKFNKSLVYVLHYWRENEVL